MFNYSFVSSNSRKLADCLKNTQGADTILQNSIYLNNTIYSFGGVSVSSNSPTAYSVDSTTKISVNSGWTTSNSPTGNKWEIGNRSSLSEGTGLAAYITTPTNDVGYDPIVMSKSYIYIDVPVNSFESANIVLNLYIRSESSYDGVTIYAAPTSVLPVGSSTYGGANLGSLTLSGATKLTNVSGATGITNVKVALPVAFSNSTVRFIFEWANDSIGGYSGTTSGACLHEFGIEYLSSTGPAAKGPATDFCQKYDTINNTWSQIASLPVPLKDCQIFNYNNEIYIMGGLTSNGSVSNNNYKYNPSTNTYTTLPAPPSAAYYVACSVYGTLTVAGASRFYMLGGINALNANSTNSGVFYIPSTNTWGTISDAVFPSIHSGACAVMNNKLYYTVGIGGTSTNGHNFYFYDPSKNGSSLNYLLNFLPISNIDPAVICRSMVSIQNDLFLLHGTNMYRFNEGLYSWQKINAISNYKDGSSLVSDGSKIYCISGYEQPSVGGTLIAYTPDTLKTYSGDYIYDNFSVPSNWTIRNFNTTNSWVIGTNGSYSTSGQSAYITTNGSTKGYSINSNSRTVYLYRSYSVPAGASDITLRFRARVNSESNYDGLIIFHSTSTSISPIASSSYVTFSSATLSGATRQASLTGSSTANSLTNYFVPLPAGSSGTIIFCWTNDSLGGPGNSTNTGVTLDDIVINYAVPLN